MGGADIGGKDVFGHALPWLAARRPPLGRDLVKYLGDVGAADVVAGYTAVQYRRAGCTCKNCAAGHINISQTGACLPIVDVYVKVI
jgi:hypothetical protein